MCKTTTCCKDAIQDHARSLCEGQEAKHPFHLEGPGHCCKGCILCRPWVCLVVHVDHLIRTKLAGGRGRRAHAVLPMMHGGRHARQPADVKAAVLALARALPAHARCEGQRGGHSMRSVGRVDWKAGSRSCGRAASRKGMRLGWVTQGWQGWV